MGDSAYSFSLTTFRRTGKLLQIEYALMAVQQGKTSLGIKGERNRLVYWLVLRHIRILEKQECTDARECWYLRLVVGVFESLCPHVPTATYQVYNYRRRQTNASASYRYKVDGPTLVRMATKYSCFCTLVLRIWFT